MNNDEIKRLAREIAEHSVDYTPNYGAPVRADAYAGSSAEGVVERTKERPDELTMAIVKWAAMEIEKYHETEKLRRRIGFIALFACVVINLFILSGIVSIVAYIFIVLAAI